MTKEETEKNFNIERKKHFEFYLPFYQEKNWIVVNDNIDGNKPISWDVEIEVFAGQFKKVDEKVLTHEWNNCLIEIIQDMETGSLGWFFGEKDWVLYGSWNDLEEIYPSSLYLISMNRLKPHIYGLKKMIPTVVSHKGWGITWNLRLDWVDLTEKEIIQKLI